MLKKYKQVFTTIELLLNSSLHCKGSEYTYNSQQIIYVLLLYHVAKREVSLDRVS